MKQFMGHDIEPGWCFSVMDRFLDLGWRGVVIWGVLFVTLAPLSFPPMTVAAWVLNPPWRFVIAEPPAPPCPSRQDGKHAWIVGNGLPYCFNCGVRLQPKGRRT